MAKPANQVDETWRVGLCPLKSQIKVKYAAGPQEFEWGLRLWPPSARLVQCKALLHARRGCLHLGSHTKLPLLCCREAPLGQAQAQQQVCMQAVTVCNTPQQFSDCVWRAQLLPSLPAGGFVVLAIHRAFTALHVQDGTLQTSIKEAPTCRVCWSAMTWMR